MHAMDKIQGLGWPLHVAAHLPLWLAVVVQVQEWKLKCDAIEKRENERREAEAKKHKEEVRVQRER